MRYGDTQLIPVSLLNALQSLKVKSNYIEQLRNFNIISTHFLPNIFALLRMYEGILKTFKLDVWAVDEFYVQCKNAQRSTPSSRPGLILVHYSI